MDTLFPESANKSLEAFDEAMEVGIHRVCEAVIEHAGVDALAEMILPYLVQREAILRAKFPADDPMFDILNDYHEQVRLGLREPLLSPNG